MTIFPGSLRRDGKRKVVLVFSNGVHLTKLLTEQQIVEILRDKEQNDESLSAREASCLVSLLAKHPYLRTVAREGFSKGCRD